MSDFSLMAWGEDDSRGGVRHRIGTWLLKQAVRILSVNSLKVYHWYPEGLGGEKQRIVISPRRVDYWRDQEYEDGLPVYLVKHNEDGILDAYLFWKDAKKCASAHSQHFEEYHYREHVLNEETDRIVIAEHEIDELEQNLEVEKIHVNRELDWDEWDESDRLINSDNVRTVEDVKEQPGLVES